jgi:hypothetical protein
VRSKLSSVLLRSFHFRVVNNNCDQNHAEVWLYGSNNSGLRNAGIRLNDFMYLFRLDLFHPYE